MKCKTVRTRLATYLDEAITQAARAEERVQIRGHLEVCSHCRTELEGYRRLAVLLSHTPKFAPPSDLAVRIRVAAAQGKSAQDFPTRWRRMRDRAEIRLANVLRSLTVPATVGFLYALHVFD